MARGGKRAKSFHEVFDFLKKNDNELYILSATKFEFLGYSTNKKDFDKLADWLGDLTTLSIRKQDIEEATKLSSMYKCKNPSINPKQISFVDCLHATQLLHFKDKVFLVTTDNNDYPSFLFDMPKHIAIEENNGNTIFVGFKTFNGDKFNDLTKTYTKSG